ncbi:MAG: Helix-turn-helix domain [Frankiales bacterium]|nr:Helix-turn-helix domain [Frankiales bacterium]
MPAADDPFLSTSEAAKVLSWSRDSVLRAIDAGALEGLRYGRLVRVRRSALDAFIAANTTSASTVRPRRRRRRR